MHPERKDLDPDRLMRMYMLGAILNMTTGFGGGIGVSLAVINAIMGDRTITLVGAGVAISSAGVNLAIGKVLERFRN